MCASRDLADTVSVVAILCSQCGAQVPRPDVSRGPIVCPRCATLRSANDDEDMATVDHPPPPRAQSKPPPAAGRPATIPAPPPVAPARPSMIPRPVVGGPPGHRIRAGESRATPSVAPRPATTPPPRASVQPPAKPSIPAPPGSKPAAPPPRPRPEIKGGSTKVAEDMDTSEFAPLETGDFDDADDINLATGDFESIPEKDRPPLKPPRP